MQKNSCQKSPEKNIELLFYYSFSLITFSAANIIPNYWDDLNVHLIQQKIEEAQHINQT